MSKPTLDNSNIVMRFLLYVEWTGLILITLATIVALGQEILLVFHNHRVELHDILLVFIYLEIFTMVALYFTSGKLPVRYPIYISIVAIARYIVLSIDETNASDIIWLSLSILGLTIAAIVLRFGHSKFPDNSRVD